MRHVAQTLVLTLALTLPLSACIESTPTERPVQVAATCDAQLLSDDAKVLIARSGAATDDVNAAKALATHVVNNWVEQEMLQYDARTRGLWPTSAQVETEMARLFAAYPGTALNQMLADELRTLETLRADVASRLAVDAVLRSLPMPTPPTDAALRATFDTATRVDAQDIRLRHILVPTREEAEQIQVLLRSSGDFASVARARSIAPDAVDGGLLPWRLNTQAMPVFEALRDLPIGELSPILESEGGFHLAMVEDRRPARAGFAEYREAALDQWASDARHSALRQHLLELKNRCRADFDPAQVDVLADAIRAAHHPSPSLTPPDAPTTSGESNDAITP